MDMKFTFRARRYDQLDCQLVIYAKTRKEADVKIDHLTREMFPDLYLKKEIVLTLIAIEEVPKTEPDTGKKMKCGRLMRLIFGFGYLS